MSVVAVEPIILQESVLKIASTPAGDPDAGDDFAAALNSIRINPTASTVTYKGLKRNVHTFPTLPEWTAVLNYAQDWATGTTLSRFLFDHMGEKLPAIVEPVDGEGTSWELTLVITPGAIGGDVDAVMTAEVTLGVDGAPVPVAIP
jgi:hypothetical protein